VRGIVRVVGADPFPQVVVRTGDAGPGVGVLGLLREEIGSLDGIEVSVVGPAVANQPPVPPRAVNVRSYEILSAAGLPAKAGLLVRRGDAFWLVGSRDSIEIATPVADGVVVLVGKRIFIGGVVKNGRISAQAFGVIGRR
jgi:hypothetical protein